MTPEAQPNVWVNLIPSDSRAPALATTEPLSVPAAAPSPPPAEPRNWRPTTEQLAVIAATLARKPNETPEMLVDRAMEIWIATIRKISSYDCQPSNGEGLLVKTFRTIDELYTLDGKTSCTRDGFLRKLLPQYKTKTADLAKIGKAFLRDGLLKKSGKEPAINQVGLAWGNWEPFKENNLGRETAKDFKEWYKAYVSEAKRKGGKQSAKVQADKRKALVAEKMKKNR